MISLITLLIYMAPPSSFTDYSQSLSLNLHFFAGGLSGADLVDAPLGTCFGDNIIRRPGKMGKVDKRETYVNMNMLMREQDYTDLETFK